MTYTGDTLMVEFQELRKSGELGRGGETVLARVWCALPDNTDPLTDLMEAHIKSSNLQHAALIWIQAELFYYPRTSCYYLLLLSPASEPSSLPVKLLIEPRKAVSEIAGLLHSQKWYPEILA